jgi:hypothetical protein
MTGFGEVFARFDAELDAAVSRARRVSAEARAESARFRERTAKLTESVRDRSLNATPDELTSEQLREQATKFRDEHGLPVEALPSAAELAREGLVREPAPPAGDDDEDFSQERILSASVSRDDAQPEPVPPVRPARADPPRRRPVPRTTDDDEDFSQERILFEG